MEPRFTESVQTVPRSTVGAAGRKRYTSTVRITTTMAIAAAMAIWRLRLRSLNSGRAISITLGGGNFMANTRASQMHEIKGDNGRRHFCGEIGMFAGRLYCQLPDSPEKR